MPNHLACMGIFEQNPEKVKQDKILSITTQKYINISLSTGRNEGAVLIKRISPIVWQNVNLLTRFEFHRQQSVINLDEIISLLEQKIIWQQPKVTEEVLASKFLLYLFGVLLKNTHDADIILGYHGHSCENIR